MLQYTQGFETFPLVNACRREEEVFKKNFKRIPRRSAPRDEHTIASLTIYQVKARNNLSLHLKEQILPLGNEDNIKVKWKRTALRVLHQRFG